MKHIKLFEGFDNDDYFQHIDNDDWWDNRYARIEMSSRTIEVISGLFSNWDIDVDDNKDMISADNQNVSIKKYFYEIKVYEVDDEYFYVQVHALQSMGTRSYPNGGTFCYCYRCDQLEGLIQFLKNGNII
jgi:hypothetical protein